MMMQDIENKEDEGKAMDGMFLVGVCVAPQVQMTRIQHSDLLYPGKWKSYSDFCEGQFLQNDKVRGALGEFLPTIRGGPHQRFPSLQEVCLGLEAPRFPIICLKHVTTLENFRNIVNEGAIRGAHRTFLLQGSPVDLPVSCWSPHFPLPEVESFKNKRYSEFIQRLEDCGATYAHLSPEEKGDLRDMLAISPALRPDSRYGNFQFTFRLEELLGSYSQQHCGGQEPVLRVLGTEAHKLEVVYWVLIHSPSSSEFHHLPRVDSVWPRSRAGNLMWGPESTTDLYTWFIDPSSGRLGKYPWDCEPQKMYAGSRWNNVVFAFHLPEGRTLYLGRDPLLGGVEACETAKSLWGDGHRILRHPVDEYIPQEHAKYIIYGERAKASH
ncbi:hypothetical protein NDU88_009220 [Pleurodeles waltl]|uniref:Uncharacterized protein n=1 Tax=Pleurodeles waltl TaxID=8319 RepID=A0AAV7NYL9_PLEWA|nr:hypothetical protein NDU88_009220 [Pleurodeles waltl]